MITPLKVLMVGDLPLNLESVKGGVESAILNLFSGYALLETIEVVHVSFVDGLKNRVVHEFAKNVRIYSLPFKSPYRLVDYVLNRGELRKLIQEEDPHIIHIQESGPHLLRFIDYPKHNIVVTQHGIMKEEFKYAAGLFEKLKFLFKVVVEAWIFPLFPNIVFISDYNRRLFSRKNLKLSTKIYNSVNPIFFASNPVASSPNTIIYVGVINRRKNIGIIINVLADLRKRGIVYELHVVGGFKDQEYEREIMLLINQYELANQITFYGWLNQEDILDVYARCRYFILPSLQETLPVSIAEAMALGKIVMATDVGAVAEMFEDKVTGYLFSKNEVTDLIQLLETFNANQPAGEQFSEEVRKSARLKFHPERNAQSTLEFYQRVIKTHQAE